MFAWDEAKRKSNLKKHGLDFIDAHLVYDDLDKCTYETRSEEEFSWMDIALVAIKGRVLALV